MDIIHYFALERMYRERRRLRQKVYVTTMLNGLEREGKIIKEDDGRWLVELYPYEDETTMERGSRLFLGIREFDIHPVDQGEFEDYLAVMYDEYGDL